eukprot:Phypoly_transcript_03581.p1 GENE.Phypoly_transcript_03581~~Phypoly_transcript_03581.p1  ORF type:complete len:510 (+),score=54.89 Phypoly_transcript_03581:807-2336(+)
MEGRKSNYKKTLVKGEASKKRVESSTKLQKDKREKSINSKRSRRDISDGEVSYSPDDLAHALQQIQGKDPAGLRILRKILCVEYPPIHDILQSPTQAVNNIIHFLKSGDEVQQLDAAWCITNLATGTHEETAAVVQAAPYLIQHLSGNNNALVEQCAWALGNISADCLEHRDVLRANGIIKPLLTILRRYTSSSTRQSHSLARTAAFALANQARGQNPKIEDILNLNAAPILVQILANNIQKNDEMNDGTGVVDEALEVQIETAWVITYMTAQLPNAQILADAGLLPLLAQHLVSQSPALVIPILRSVGNIIARSDPLTNRLLDSSITPPLIPILRDFLSSNHRAVQKEAAYVISNIAAGPQAHVAMLVHHHVVEALVPVLCLAQFDLSREAAFALSNIASDSRYIEGIVACGAVSGMLSLLRSPDSEMAHLALTFVEMVLMFHPQGPSIIENEDGIEKLEALQFHENQALYQLANQLIDKYFGGDDFEEESEEPSVPVEYPSWRVHQV